MFPSKLEPHDQPRILDIRQGHNSFNLGDEITKGLRKYPRSIPSLLLWDDSGLELFDRFSQRPAYYSFHSEIEILSRYGSSIGANIPADSLLLELGCGAIRKTRLILSGLRKQPKPIHYIALDVSRESLYASLAELEREFADCRFISIAGLLGTYDDCIAWLSGLKSLRERQSVTIMFLGNSFGNIKSPDEASGFLERFSTACQHAQLACRFLVSTDICQKHVKVLEAYNVQTPEFRTFLINALRSANLALGYEAFSPADWIASNWLDIYERTLRLYVTAKHDLLIPLPLPGNKSGTVTIRKGERIHLINSAKWNEEDMGSICKQAGFQIQQRWKDVTGDYCVYLLAQDAGW
ncbi:histidine-specific methyltransferase [Xylaria nigripes]|nr:histidine-specific methyltransferase [Xylaria nigripes]